MDPSPPVLEAPAQAGPDTGPAPIPPAQLFRPGLTERLAVTSGALLIGCLALVVVVIAAASFNYSLLLFAVMFPVSAVMVWLSWLVAREALSRWRLHARIDAGILHLVLPRKRGLIEQPGVDCDLPLADIERFETRVEMFTSMGITTGQRAYALVKRSGERVYLGADRDMVPAYFQRLVSGVAAHAGLPVRELGTVSGDSGFLLVAGQSAPDWSAPSLPENQVASLERRRARTPLLVMAAALLVVIARLLAGD